MRASVALRQQYQATIESELVARVQAHQAEIARLRTGAETLRAMGGTAPVAPLVLLAHGDSWFDYPLTGNSLPFSDTDIIAQLKSMGTRTPVILNLSHYGDATTEELSLPKQERLIRALKDPGNWLSAGTPDAILFSGGGNDIAGNQFCIFLDYATGSSSGLDKDRFRGVLDMVQASYEDLFAFRDVYAHGVPIFAHCYDYPIPNGVHPACAGPWLQPSLRYCGWTDVTKGAAILRDALQQFRAMLQTLAATPANNFTLIDTQGTLTSGDWANELHPVPTGFLRLAELFVAALRARFPTRL